MPPSRTIAVLVTGCVNVGLSSCGWEVSPLTKLSHDRLLLIWRDLVDLPKRILHQIGKPAPSQNWGLRCSAPRDGLCVAPEKRSLTCRKEQ